MVPSLSAQSIRSFADEYQQRHCQYLYFCTSKASKMRYLEHGAVVVRAEEQVVADECAAIASEADAAAQSEEARRILVCGGVW